MDNILIHVYYFSRSQEHANFWLRSYIFIKYIWHNKRHIIFYLDCNAPLRSYCTFIKFFWSTSDLLNGKLYFIVHLTIGYDGLWPITVLSLSGGQSSKSISNVLGSLKIEIVGNMPYNTEGIVWNVIGVPSQFF